MAEIKIELGREDRNINPYFEPAGLSLRGKHRRSSVTPALQADYAHVPDMPGYVIAVDPEKGHVRRYDPLENDRRRPSIEAALTKHYRKPVAIARPVTDTVSKTTMRHYLLWMWRLVNAGDAELLEGKWPEWVSKAHEDERDADAKRAGLSPAEIEMSKELAKESKQPAAA